MSAARESDMRKRDAARPCEEEFAKLAKRCPIREDLGGNRSGRVSRSLDEAR